MARLLHDDGLLQENDHSGITDASGTCDHGHRHSHHRRHHHECDHHRRNKLIPVGNITIDCTPVSFHTPGQARNIVSCAVDQIVNVPITRSVNVQTPIPGCPCCFVCETRTETVMVPVMTTVNVPAVLTPVPRIVCSPTAAFVCPCVQTGTTVTM
jgi:hypothetical protein